MDTKVPDRGAIVPQPDQRQGSKSTVDEISMYLFFSFLFFIIIIYIIIIIIRFDFDSDRGEEGFAPVAQQQAPRSDTSSSSNKSPSAAVRRWRGEGQRSEFVGPALRKWRGGEKCQQAKRGQRSEFVGPAIPSLDVASQSPLPTPSNLAPPPTPPALPSAASFAGWPLGGGPSIAVPHRGCR